METAPDERVLNARKDGEVGGGQPFTKGKGVLFVCFLMTIL